MAGRGQQVTDQDRSTRPVRRLLESFHSTDSYGLVLLMIVMTYVLATTLIHAPVGAGTASTSLVCVPRRYHLPRMRPVAGAGATMARKAGGCRQTAGGQGKDADPIGFGPAG